MNIRLHIFANTVWFASLCWAICFLLIPVTPQVVGQEVVGQEVVGHETAKTESTKYDPLQTAAGKVKQLTFSVNDQKRSREIPLRVYLPTQEAEPAPAPVILFSHGLGESRDNGQYVGNHWAARGYVVVFMQHAGSDESVWKDQRLGGRLQAMKQAANAENFMSRVGDVPAVIDQLQVWHEQPEHPLHGILDLKKIGMSGHSFGAVTTQAVSGQTFMGRASATESRIQAALAMSPSTPRNGNADKAFGKVKIPWLLMTGTNDVSMINDTDVESRLSVYPALPPGDKYELVLDQAEHSAFSDRAAARDRSQRNPNHHRVILALSTAFWDAYLKEDAEAAAWLKGEGPRTVLEKADRWQLK